MERTTFTIQSRDGGPEVRFDMTMAAQLGAKYKLRKDPEYKTLDKSDQLGVLIVAEAIYSARDHGVEVDFEIPDNMTLSAVLAFDRKYVVSIDAFDPDKKDGQEEEDDANPTATTPASS